MPQPYVLICVTGLTPQIVTETLYALARSNDPKAPPNLPAAIHILTTSRGKALIEASLTGPKGHIAAMGMDYDWPVERIDFGTDNIHVITDLHGQPLDDLREAEDNQAAADFITRFIRQAARGTTRLHVSMAGGRKTMGYFTGYALSLYGRPEDELSHVLVNPPFESHSDFFYPPAQPIQLQDQDGRSISTSKARITLASIPFVRLRNGMDDRLLSGDLSFSDSVARTQQLLDPPQLCIDLSARQVWLQGEALHKKLSPTHFLWLTWLADRGRRDEPPIAFDEQAIVELQKVTTWLEGSGPGRLRDSLDNAGRELARDERSYFERTRSKLNRALHERSNLCPAAVRRYEIHSFGQHAYTRYGLNLAPDAIRIEGDP